MTQVVVMKINTFFSCKYHEKKLSLYVSYKTCNQPKPPETSQNMPKPPKTSQNNLKRAKITHNQPKQVKTTHNQPKPAETTKSMYKYLKFHFKFFTTSLLPFLIG